MSRVSGGNRSALDSFKLGYEHIAENRKRIHVPGLSDRIADRGTRALRVLRAFGRALARAAISAISKIIKLSRTYMKWNKKD